MAEPVVVFDLLVSIAFLVIGLVILWRTRKQFYSAGKTLHTWMHLRKTEPVGPGELPESGHVLVRGTVSADTTNLLTSPFSGTDAVAHRYRITQRSGDTGWSELLDDTEMTAFELQDGVDSVRVTPGNHTPRIPIEQSLTVGANESLPEETVTQLETSTAIDLDETPLVLAEQVDEPREYEEGFIEPGETLYVYGKIVTDGTSDKTIDADSSLAFGMSSESAGDVSPETSDEDLPAESLLGTVIMLLIGLTFVALGGSLFFRTLTGVLGI